MASGFVITKCARRATRIGHLQPIEKAHANRRRRHEVTRLVGVAVAEMRHRHPVTQVLSEAFFYLDSDDDIDLPTPKLYTGWDVI